MNSMKMKKTYVRPFTYMVNMDESLIMTSGNTLSSKASFSYTLKSDDAISNGSQNIWRGVF